MSWSVSGNYFEACNCETACPCIFLSPPTTGECTAVVGWQIEDGNHEGTDLAGLNVALAVHSPGHMAEVPWQAALYLDERASEEQAGALGAIFSGAAGGHPARLAGHIGEVLGVASAAIAFEADGDSRTLQVGDVADIKVTAVAGADGSRVTIENHPLVIALGNPAVAARSDRMHYADHGFEWDLSGRNGLFSPFGYEG